MDKTIAETPFLRLVERDGWYYFAQIPNSMGGVMILLYKTTGSRTILGRYEVCPAHDEHRSVLTTIAGGIEPGDKPVATAIKEVHEEAGYRLLVADLIDLGTCRLSTNQDTTVYLFAADVTNKERGDAPGDGTRGEEGSYCDWVTPKAAINSKSSYFSALMMRAYINYGIKLF